MKCKQLTDFQVIDISEATLEPMTLEKAHIWYRQQGINTLSFGGNDWKEKYPGFFEPIDMMTRLSAEQATRPKLISWGFRSALCEADAAMANGYISVHLLSNVPEFDISKLKRKRRNRIRKSQKLFQFVKLQGSKLLEEQGYEIFCSASRRIGAKTLTKKAYIKAIRDYFSYSQNGWCILAGLINGQLAGYMTGYAIDDTGYCHNSYVANELLGTSLDTGLVYEFVNICRRSEKILQIVDGPVIPSKPSLQLFKTEMGFPVHHIPAKVWINPIAKAFIRRRYGNTDLEYILTGKLIHT